MGSQVHAAYIMGLSSGNFLQSNIEWLFKSVKGETICDKKMKIFRQAKTMLLIGVPYYVYRYPSRVRIIGGCASMALMTGNEVVTVKKKGKDIEEKIPNYIYGALKAMKANTKASAGLLQNLSRATIFDRDNKTEKGIRRDIRIFQKLYDMPKSDLQKYKTFNDFFSREESNRPIQAEESNFVCSPADCRMVVFDSINSAKDIWIKGNKFSVSKLLEGCENISEFESGALCICRLCPYDSHQFCLPVTAEEIKEIKNDISTRNVFPTIPAVVQDEKENVYTENVRKIIQIETKEFSTVYFVAVGSSYVGGIVFEDILPKTKGSKLGKFQYGGSTILLLFKPGVIKFEDPLNQTSQVKIETYMQMGETVGKLTTEK